MENFYMTLPSNQTTHFFPRNTGIDYTVMLPKTLNFQPNSLEVGLAELYYARAEPPKDVNGNYILPDPKFFGKVKDDDIIQVLRHSQSGFSIKNTQKDVLDFIKDLQEELRKVDYGVKFELSVTDVGQLIIVDNYGLDKNSLAISQELAEILGFDKSTFPPGRHTAERPFSESKFQDLFDDTEFVISLFGSKPYQVKVEEPKKYEIGYLMIAINTSLDPFDCAFDFVGSELEFESSNTGVMVKLSPQLGEILGILPDQWFHETEMRVKANPDLILYVPPKFMMITCSCVENQVYGEAMVPTLRILTIPTKYNELKQYSFSPIQYVGVNGSELSQIRIQVIDDQLRPMSVSSQPSTVVLHFRSRLPE